MQPVSTVPDRIKQQLLWAFDRKGILDPDMFRSILSQEGYDLSPRELALLVKEVASTASCILHECKPQDYLAHMHRVCRN